MTAVNNLLDRYRETCSIASDNALSEKLGIRRQAVYQWRKGMAWPSDSHIVKIAESLRDEPAGWLAAIHAEKVDGPARKAWLKAAKQLGYAATFTLACVALAPSTSNAAQADISAHNSPGVYIMSNYE